MQAMARGTCPRFFPKALPMKLRLTIRWKLFLYILLAILVSFAILLFITARNIETSLEEKISRDLEANLNFFRYQFFTGASQIKYALLLPASSHAVKEQLKNRDTRGLRELLIQLKQNLPFVKVAAFVDSGKRVVADAGNRESGYPFELDGILEKAFKHREPVVSTELATAAFLCREGDTSWCMKEKPGEDVLLATVAIPLIDEGGGLLGAVVAGAVITRETVIPYKIQEAYGSDLEVTITRRDLRQPGESEENPVLPEEQIRKILSSLVKGATYRGEVQFGPTHYKAAFEPVTNVRGELIGALSVAVSKEYFDRLRRNNLHNLLMSALFGTFLSFLIAYLVSRHLTVPLKELIKGAQCIEAGNLDYRADIGEADEMGTLASSFNRMAEALAERDATIKSKALDLEVLNRCLHEMNELLDTKVLERTTELQVEKGRLEAILTSMAEGVVVTDRENRVILFNSAAQRIFGIAPYKMIGRSLDDIDIKGGFHQLVTSLREMSKGDLLAEGEKEVAIGRMKLRVSLSPLLDQSWEFAGVVMSIRDVTNEEEVDRMKTEFISTVSHELKTPLTSMKGSLQVILGKGEGLTETQRELLRVCMRNTERLIRLISDILDISKIEAGRVDFSMKSLSVDKLITYAIEEISAFAREKEISLVNGLDGEPPPVLGDYDRLVQIMTNLLSNAVKFSPGKKTVTVTARREGEFVVISVHDEGKPIERSDRDKLFRKFHQLRGPGEGGGSGLGLAICREIIERHHGRIWYTAGKGGGNTFSFTVPVCGEQV
jgi:PAS domain S-box-containing protein